MGGGVCCDTWKRPKVRDRSSNFWIASSHPDCLRLRLRLTQNCLLKTVDSSLLLHLVDMYVSF